MATPSTAPTNSAAPPGAAAFANNANAAARSGSSPLHNGHPSAEDQRLEALWAEIEQDTPANVNISLTVKPNHTGCPCVDNPCLISARAATIGPAIPIHGHQWRLAHGEVRDTN